LLLQTDEREKSSTPSSERKRSDSGACLTISFCHKLEVGLSVALLLGRVEYSIRREQRPTFVGDERGESRKLRLLTLTEVGSLCQTYIENSQSRQIGNYNVSGIEGTAFEKFLI
jgi:hypothetical protein